MSDDMQELVAEYEVMTLHPEARPAIARTKEPVMGEDGFISHYEVTEKLCVVHTIQVGRGGWVCEFEDGTVRTIGYENVRFVDDEEE